MFTEFKGCTVNAFLIRARLLLFECTSGLYQGRYAGIVLLQIYLTKAPNHHQLLWVSLHVFAFSGLTLMCCQPQASTFWKCSFFFFKVISSQWQWKEFTSKKQKQWRYAIISHESDYWAALFHWKFFLSVCHDIFVLKVTKLWVWACCCVYVAHIAGGE